MPFSANGREKSIRERLGNIQTCTDFSSSSSSSLTVSDLRAGGCETERIGNRRHR